MTVEVKALEDEPMLKRVSGVTRKSFFQVGGSEAFDQDHVVPSYDGQGHSGDVGLFPSFLHLPGEDVQPFFVDGAPGILLENRARSSLTFSTASPTQAAVNLSITAAAPDTVSRPAQLFCLNREWREGAS